MTDPVGTARPAADASEKRLLRGPSAPVLTARQPSDPPLPPLFGDRWPVPDAPPTLAMIAGTAVVGVTVAGALPQGPPGLGWLVIALVTVAATLGVEWRQRRLTPAGVWWTGATIALTAVATLRAAEWLGTICVLVAFGTGALAIVGRSGRGVTAAVCTIAIAAGRAMPWFGKSMGERTDVRTLCRVGVAVACGALLLLVFGGLLAEADEAFAVLVNGLSPTVDDDTMRWFALLLLGATAMAGVCFLLRSLPAPRPAAERARLRGLEWTIPIGMLVALFTAFVIVTIGARFASPDQFLGAGLTYAENARSGFWELVAVTALALAVIMAAARLAPVATPVQRRAKRALLLALAALTLIVVASATYRMTLYQQAYGHTVLRLLVLTFELWLGSAFVLVAVAVARLRDRVPVSTLFGTGVATLLLLAVLNPEGMVTRGNVDRFAVTGSIDSWYLSRLSADMVPALDGLPGPLRDCVAASILNDGARPADWRSANLTRGLATAGPTCSDFDLITVDGVTSATPR